MSDPSADKVAIIATHGPEDPERATLPFVMANAALVMETEAVVILQGNGVLLAGRASMNMSLPADCPRSRAC